MVTDIVLITSGVISIILAIYAICQKGIPAKFRELFEDKRFAKRD